jgi:ArsR family transcriptional regulator
MRQTTKLFKALSDSNRIRILKMLSIRELCVCEITDILGLAASTVSKHLSILRDLELILDRKDGRWINYSLNKTSLSDSHKKALELIELELNFDETILTDLKKVNTVNRDLICNL